MGNSHTSYKWAEIERHSKLSDAWIVLDNKVYNITDWISKHPGGQNMILQELGRDATVIFETAHFDSSRDARLNVLKPYFIGDLSRSK